LPFQTQDLYYPDMPQNTLSDSSDPSSRLARDGYWPAQADRLFGEGRYAATISLCREHMTGTPCPVSGRTIYALALYHSGQSESAAEQFRLVLAVDPDHQIALKYLGDIRFAEGDEAAAMAYYQRVLELDPDCGGLKDEIRRPARSTTRTISLRRGTEERAAPETILANWPFFTETIGDLFLAQGHPRLAAEVYRRVAQTRSDPRVLEKLAQTESKIKEKES